MDIQLRLAVEADATALAALRERVAAEGSWIGDPADPFMSAGAWRARLSGPRHLTVSAVDDDEIVGYASVTETSGVGSLGMGIGEHYRGQGLGGRLLDRALEETRARASAHKIDLGVWPHNEAAIRLYVSRGFVIEGRRARHYRRPDGALWDVVKMGLIIDNDSPGSPFPDSARAITP